MLAWFNLGLVATGLGPTIAFPGTPWPKGPAPIGLSLARTGTLFIDILPLIALQYLIALRSRTFLAPLGIGMAIWIVSVSTLGWEHAYLFPYAYAAMEYPKLVDPGAVIHAPIAIRGLAALVFVAAALAGYVAYQTKSDRG